MKKREVEEAKKLQPDSISLFGSQRLVCTTVMLIIRIISPICWLFLLLFPLCYVMYVFKYFLHVCLALYVLLVLVLVKKNSIAPHVMLVVINCWCILSCQL